MSGYFERIEHHLLDAVERETPVSPIRARTRIAVATAAGLAAIVALAVAGLLAAVGGSDPDRAALDRPPTLNDALAVLRREQRPGDAPPQVVAAAAAAAGRAAGRFHGTIDPRSVRQLVQTGPQGHRLYLAPVVTPGAPTSVTGALVVLTHRSGRLARQPYGLTVGDLLPGRAWYLTARLRPVPGTRSGSIPRSLQIQLVPDGVTAVRYSYPVPAPGADPTPVPDRDVPAENNAVATVLVGSAANRYPAEAAMLDADGAAVGRARPRITGRGPLAPETACRGVELPARPWRRPRIGVGSMTVHEICRRSGLPAEAYRRDAGHLLLRYPDGTVIGTASGRISSVWHLAPGGTFPPRFPEVLTPARTLGRYQIAPRP